MKFQKKRVIVDAYQTDKDMYIETLEGVMHASPGDWIITGVNGEKYPCKPDIFEKTYEPVSEWVFSLGEAALILEAFHLLPSEESRFSMLWTKSCSLVSSVPYGYASMR